MELVLIKHFFLTICSIWVVRNLLNVRVTPAKLVMLKALAFSALTSFGVYAVRFLAAPFGIYFMVALAIIFNFRTLKLGIKPIIAATITSFGIVYCAYEVGVLLTFLLEGLRLAFPDVILPRWVLAIIIGVIQSLLIFAIFRIKRLQSGMPFIKEYFDSELIVYICVSLLVVISIWGMVGADNLTYAFPPLFVFICAMLLWFGWRTRLTKEYMEQLKKKEISALNAEIAELKDAYHTMSIDNERMAKLLHKDNKLVPALVLFSQQILLLADEEAFDQHKREQFQLLKQQIDDISKERAGIIKDYDRQLEHVCTTGIQSLDMMLSYLQHKAAAFDISFELSVSCDLALMVPDIIPEPDLRTLFADLIENAIIATKASAQRHVFVNVGLSHNTYFVDFFDSGTPFEISTLINWGIKPASTHLDDGGSGIGLMTTTELCKKYGISIEITEIPNSTLYSKKVSLYFDGRCEYRINSPRAELIQSSSVRDDIIFI